MADTTAQLVPFQYENERVRLLDIDGEPWFVLTDLCRVLGLGTPSRVRDRLAEGVSQTHTLQTAGGAQQMIIVSEPGMYEVVIRSDKPEAARFRRWITAEVLPTIRRTGSYGAPALSGAELLAHAVLEAQQMLAAKDEQIAELAPKAELADAYLTADAGGRLLREAAKAFGMQEKELRAFLLSEGMIFVKYAPCGNRMYDFKSQFAPHFEAHETVVNHAWGSCNHYTLRITPRGIDLIRKRIARKELAA